MVEQEASTAAKSNAESQVRVDTLFVVLAGITEPQFFKTRERLPFFLASKLVGRFTSVDRNLIREEVHQKLQFALNQLETEDRELLAMRYYEELTSDEIAMTMGGELTGSGVRKRLLQSLRKLRQAFQPETDMKT